MSVEKNAPKWKAKDIRAAILKYDSYGRHLVVPTYQRGRCWKNEKEIALIDSLKKGYPIGALLFYKHEKEDVYTIVDGLQRCNTIKKYLSCPGSLFQKKDVPEEVINNLNNVTGVEDKEKIGDAFCQIVPELDFNDVQYSFIAEKLVSILAVKECDEKAISKIIEPFFKALKKEYKEIEDFEISVIVYTGEAGNLNDIFKRINEKTITLNDFEIYASAWPLERYSIEQKDIVTNVLARYDAFSKADYEVEDFEEIRNKIFKESKLTLFEFMFGFSKFLCEKYDCLSFVDIKATTDDTSINEKVCRIGFGIVNACLKGKDSSEISNLYLKLQTLNLNILVKSILECIDYVEQCIKHISGFKGNTRDKVKPLHSQYQIMSLISGVYNLRYSFFVEKTEEQSIGKIESNPEWENNKKKLDKSLVQHYVYDIISGTWNDGGTKRMYNSNTVSYLMMEIPYSLFSECLDHFFRVGKERMGENSSKTVKAPEAAEKVILNCIYTNVFTASQQLSKDSFDIEHIATKERMSKLIKTTGIDSLPISCIANLCYLPEYVNRSKGEKTFYQDDKYLSKVSLEYIEENYSFTTSNDLEWISGNYTKSDAKRLKISYIEFLNHRFEIQKEKVLSTLKIVKEQDKKDSVVPVLPLYSGGSVPEYIREAMRLLCLSEYQFFPEQIEFLKGHVFGSWLPFLVEEGELEECYKKRYDKQMLVLNGKSFYMSQQLTNKVKSIEKFTEWYEML